MWTWSFEWDDIRPDLVVGSCPRIVENFVDLKRAGVAALLSLQEDHTQDKLRMEEHMCQEALTTLGLKLVNVPMRDFNVEDQRQNLLKAVCVLHKLLNEHPRVFVHCTAGINRAPLVVVGYLTFVEGRSYNEALSLVQQGRPDAAPYHNAWEGARTDILRTYQDNVRRRAKSLYQANPRRKSQDNWFRAEREILVEVCTTGNASADPVRQDEVVLVDDENWLNSNQNALIDSAEDDEHDAATEVHSANGYATLNGMGKTHN